MSTPAGWYPDPEREGATRWWDGSAWAPSGAAPDAAAATADSAATGATAEVPASPFDGRSQAAATESVDVPKPSWASESTPSWQQGSTPAWDGAQQSGQAQTGAQQPAGADQYGQQYGQQLGGQYDQFGGQQFGQPKKSRTGLIIGLVGGGVLLLIIVAIVIGALVLPGLLNPGNNQAGPVEPDPAAPSGFPVSVELNIAQDSQAANQITITEAGTYSFSATSTNGEDATMTLTGNNINLEDDDGGDGLDPLIETPLTPGDYTITIDEYSGDPYTGVLTIDRLS